MLLKNHGILTAASKKIVQKFEVCKKSKKFVIYFQPKFASRKIIEITWFCFYTIKFGSNIERI